MPEEELLTETEHECVDALVRAWNLYLDINENPHDRDEFRHGLHRLQDAVLARAAARAYPERYRL